MKAKYILAATVMVLTSCAEKAIDLNPTGWYSESVAYSSEENLDLYIKGLYSVLYSNADIAAGYIFDDSVTDLVKQSWYNTGGGTVNRFFYQDNVVTPESNFRSNWGLYTNIRRINEVFADVHDGYAKNLNEDVLNIRLAEVRFLRAFAYQELVIRHGGVVLRIDETKVDGPEERAKARSTEEECWDFILSEYDKAAAVLPESWSGTDAGRITKGAAIGMKARAALYAKRWQVAKDACDDLFELNRYSLVTGATVDLYNTIFTQPYNSELILPVYYQQGNGGSSYRQHNFNSYFCPPADGKAYNVSVGAAATPTDEYAGMFDIKVGDSYEAFSWDNLARYNNQPFQNRDPRFYASILYTGATWRGREIQIYDGGADGFMTYKNVGQDNDHRSTTGYLFRKFVSNDNNMNYTSILSGQYWIEMRLAEIYLIRSEALARLNEFGDAYDDLNTVRRRVGMPDLPRKSSWEDYLQDLMKERVCELGLEGHRYHDLIRWGKAQEVLDGKRLHGVEVTPTATGYSYQRIECDPQDRHFPERYNIFPIPQGELKDNTLCTQNEAWL
ncbi:MAG: RagB/SusD family nutrient uptake outer membrane protein [Bacteroidales bacterium]|nr:RagB/SusD family nutrient uptake outer membrane protein [Bacteroidales bacterium]